MLVFQFKFFLGIFKNVVDLPSANAGVAVLGNLLVGLVAGTGDGTLDGLRDVVGGLLDGLHCELSSGVLDKKLSLKFCCVK